jgi:flagellar biogenesis protein FliO
MSTGWNFQSRLVVGVTKGRITAKNIMAINRKRNHAGREL